MIFCHFLNNKNSIFSKIWYQKWILWLISIPKMYTFIYITVIVWKLQHSICFKQIWVDTPLKEHYANPQIYWQRYMQSRCPFSCSLSSWLHYNCNGLLSSVPKPHILRLQRLQNWAAIIIFIVDRRHESSPLLKTLHWLPVKRRITYKLPLLLHVYKALNGLAPCILLQRGECCMYVYRYVPLKGSVIS